MLVSVEEAPIDPWLILTDFQRSLPKGRYGGTNIFIGTMRDFNEGDDVQGMTLEHYPGMTEKHLTRICETAIERWQLVDALIVHRVGALLPDEPIVIVAAWSAHRKEAYEASRFMIEDLKHAAPFWKKESTSNGARWVESNTPS